MTLLMDAGALVAIERGDPLTIRLVNRERHYGGSIVTHGGVVGQVWRGGSARQALLAKFLAGFKIVPLDEQLGKRAGVLLGHARAADVVDAALVLLAADGDMILTSDPDDLEILAAAAGIHVEIVNVDE